MQPKLSLRRSVLVLYLVQIASYIAPLVTLPWLTRTLGPAGYGRLTFCAAVTAYFVLFTDYGFNYSATRQVALNFEDRAARSKIFWSTLLVKAMLAAAGFIVLLALMAIVPKLAEERVLLLINYVTVLGTVLTPAWYFQGRERQALLSSINIIVRLLAIPAIFLLVRSSRDVTLAAAVSAGVPMVAGGVCLGWLCRDRELVSMHRVTLRELLEVLKEGWHLFVSTASISLYGATNTVVLGLVAGNAAVGHYSAAEKLTQAAQGLLAPINQSVYPRVARLFKESRAAAFALIRSVLKIQGSFACILSLMLFAVAPPLVRLYYGPAFDETISVLRWLAWLPFLVGLSNVFGVHTMLAMGMNKTVSRILVTAGALNVVTLSVLAHWLGARGAAVAVVSTEFFVTLVMGLILKGQNLPVFFRVPAAT